MDNDPYGLKRIADSTEAKPLFSVERREQDSAASLAWRLLDSWRRPAMELFTRYTPEACFHRMATAADEINQNPGDYGFEAPLSGQFGREFFTLRKTPSLLLESRQLFGGLLSAKIEHRERGLYIRLWHRFDLGPPALVIGLISLTLGWISSDWILKWLGCPINVIYSLPLFLVTSLLIWLAITIPIQVLGHQWLKKADSDLLHFARLVLDDDKDFEGWPSLRQD